MCIYGTAHKKNIYAGYRQVAYSSTVRLTNPTQKFGTVLYSTWFMHPSMWIHIQHNQNTASFSLFSFHRADVSWCGRRGTTVWPFLSVFIPNPHVSCISSSPTLTACLPVCLSVCGIWLLRTSLKTLSPQPAATATITTTGTYCVYMPVEKAKRTCY